MREDAEVPRCGVRVPPGLAPYAANVEDRAASGPEVGFDGGTADAGPWVWPITATGGGRYGIPREGANTLETYNIYMDETPGGEEDPEEGYEVEFRVVPNSSDDGNPTDNAVLAGLDLVDLINLRDAIQQEIDNYALQALEAEAGEEELAAVDDELMP